MQNENKKKRFAGRGYYIALIACIAAVGISGYVFVSTARNSAVEASAPAVISAAPTDAGRAAAAAAATASPSPAPSDKASKERQTDRMEDAYEETMAETDLEPEPVILWPVQGSVTATFSQEALTYSQTMADWRTHEGLDIAADEGAMVTATQAGTVTAVYEDDFLGNVVVVSHNGDLATLYANLMDSPAVVVGDTVYAGQMLGQVGDSALLETAEAPHLHFEVFENGSAVDPMDYLPDN